MAGAALLGRRDRLWRLEGECVRVFSRLREAIARVRAAVRHACDSHVTLPRGTLRPGARIVITMGGRFIAAPGCVLADNATVHAELATVRFGRNAFIGIGAVIVAKEEITIGDDVLIAEYVTIRDQDHDYRSGGDDAFRTGPIRIGNRVWIGAKATITRSVTIGDGAVIGANSVVTRDVAANTVVVGAPARPIDQPTSIRQ